jgi:hypothetical protein
MNEHSDSVINEQADIIRERDREIARLKAEIARLSGAWTVVSRRKRHRGYPHRHGPECVEGVHGVDISLAPRRCYCGQTRLLNREVSSVPTHRLRDRRNNLGCPSIRRAALRIDDDPPSQA